MQNVPLDVAKGWEYNVVTWIKLYKLYLESCLLFIVKFRAQNTVLTISSRQLH